MMLYNPRQIRGKNNICVYVCNGLMFSLPKVMIVADGVTYVVTLRDVLEAVFRFTSRLQ